MDTSKLVVGQHVTLSDVLPGGGTLGVVTQVTEKHVQVEVARSGKRNGYAIDFNHDGSVATLWGWIDSSSPGPIPGLEIIGIKKVK
jgi:hypothetical protein